MRATVDHGCATGGSPEQQRLKRSKLNRFVSTHTKGLELIGVVMRISSFTLVSWLGPASPFMWVWMVNTCDAVLLTWCAVLKRDAAYTLLNVFWIFVGLVGIARAGDLL